MKFNNDIIAYRLTNESVNERISKIVEYFSEDTGKITVHCVLTYSVVTE